jgi:hypothetical protein
MKQINNSVSIFVVITLAGIITLTGCSTPTEDVRLTLCKKLVTAFIELPLAIEWRESEEKYARFEDLVTTVNIDVQYQVDEPASMQASCYYEYDETIEEDVSTHVDPLSTYNTVPYKMILDGELIEQPTFEKVVHLIVLDQGRQALEFLQKRMKKTTQ